ncbi:hypothetical protein P9112_005407 [Eukaryota sp. TZLM1-RC]
MSCLPSDDSVEERLCVLYGGVHCLNRIHDIVTLYPVELQPSIASSLTISALYTVFIEPFERFRRLYSSELRPRNPGYAPLSHQIQMSVVKASGYTNIFTSATIQSIHANLKMAEVPSFLVPRIFRNAISHSNYSFISCKHDPNNFLLADMLLWNAIPPLDKADKLQIVRVNVKILWQYVLDFGKCVEDAVKQSGLDMVS